jgi:hypothetical protein
MNYRSIQQICRKFNKCFWWSKSVTGTPRDMIERVRGYTTMELRCLCGKDSENAGNGSPRSFQIKIIERELRRRGRVGIFYLDY